MFGSTGGFHQRQFPALSGLEAADAARVLREASRRAWAGSWYRSPLAWKLLAAAIVPLLLMTAVGNLIPITIDRFWVGALMVLYVLGYVSFLDAVLYRATARQIDHILKEPETAAPAQR